MEIMTDDLEAIKQSCEALLEVYCDHYVRACQRVLLVLATKHGSADLEDVQKAIHLPAGLKLRVIPRVLGPLRELGLIHPAGSVASEPSETQSPYFTRWQVGDPTAILVWLIGGSKTASNPPTRSAD